MYTATIQQWAADTRRAGRLVNPDGVGEIGLKQGQAGTRPAARFMVQVVDNRVAAVRFQVFGCGFTIAACAAAAALAEHSSIRQVLQLTAHQVDTCLGGLPPERDYCADLAVLALQGAVRSALGTGQVETTLNADDEAHGPRMTADHPIYCTLMHSPAPPGVSNEARHLFACLLTVATQEPWPTHEALGLTNSEFTALLQCCFPAVDSQMLTHQLPDPPLLPQTNDEVREIVLEHVPQQVSELERSLACWLAHGIAARAAQPGHLWVAMGLFERPQLTAAIRQFLPTLAAANNTGMRWKRYLFKTLCERTGAVLCKSPNCGECSDYPLCFAPED